MLHKNFPFEFKSLDETGTFEATVAVFGNVDKGGDRIIPGAFAKTLAQWEASGDPIPVIFNHEWASPDAHIGVVEKAIETSQGLLVKGRLDISDNPVAKQVHRLMQRRSLKEFSFGYSVPKGGEKRAKDGANDLTQLDLAEVGPTLKGMNPATELHSVKSALAEVKQLASVTREDLEDAGRTRYAAGPTTYVYVDDFDPDNKWVVFYVSSGQDDDRYLKTTYVIAADGTVTLGDDVEVERSTSYTPKGDAETLRKDADRVAREVELAQIPDVPEPPKAPHENDDLGTQLQEVKVLLAETRAEIDALKKKAEEADKEPKARSVDPLRERADAVALEIASDGQSLRRPPKTVAPPRPDLLPLEELRDRTRDEMLGVLSGGITE